MRTVRQGARPWGVHVRKDQNKLSMKCLSSDTRFTLTNQEKEHTELPWVKIMWPTTLRTYPYTVKWVRILHEMCNPSLHISECFNRMRRGRKAWQRRGHDNILLHFHLISEKWHQNWLYLYPSRNFSHQRSSNHGMVPKGDNHSCKQTNKHDCSDLQIIWRNKQSL